MVTLDYTMIKEILIFMLLLFHFSNGETSEFQNCTYDYDSEILGGWKVCVPSGVKSSMQFNPYVPWERPDGKTELYVDISNMQIIEIESHTITLSMNIKGPIIYFFDGRSQSRHKQSFFI